jgi:hypothetical protein
MILVASLEKSRLGVELLTHWNAGIVAESFAI